jgi:hypothetical protein
VLAVQLVAKALAAVVKMKTLVVVRVLKMGVPIVRGTKIKLSSLDSRKGAKFLKFILTALLYLATWREIVGWHLG